MGLGGVGENPQFQVAGVQTGARKDWRGVHVGMSVVDLRGNASEQSKLSSKSSRNQKEAHVSEILPHCDAS